MVSPVGEEIAGPSTSAPRRGSVDFRDTPEEHEFRAELRRWIEDQRPIPPIPEDDEGRIAYLSALQSRMHAAGLSALSFPVEYGGRGLPPEYEAILLDEMGSVGLPSAWHYGYIARVILLYGNEEQKRRFLPPAFSGEERWCQGFSEPGAGSDLGSLTTRAHLDGESYVVNGQKVWTTEAKWADWCLLLVRTDPEAPTQRAMSCFIVPIDAPGLVVRPFRQITGAMEFAELFFDDVRLPVSARVGEAGEGWRIAMSTVSFERGPGDVGYIADLRRTIGRLTDVVRAGGPGGAAAASPRPDGSREMALRLARSVVDVEVLRVHVLRSLSRRTAGLATEVDASVDKLLMVRTEQALGHAELDLHGAGVLTGEEPEALHDYLWSRAASVYGGSEQIQRTIVATRLLGLPRGP
jgi:alkylation response protein AidB-like acyl-CoA dehydrogenase